MAVEYAALDLQCGSRVHRSARILLAHLGKAFPQRRRQYEHWKIGTQGSADGFGSVGGQGNHPTQARQCLAPVLARIVVPVLGGNGVEFPGNHTHHRALNIGRGLVRRCKRNEQAILPRLLQLPIERIHFGGRGYDVNLPKAFEQGSIGLEHKIVTVLGTTETLADGAVVDVGVENEIHGIPW